MDDQAQTDLAPIPAKKIQSNLPISKLGVVLPANMKEVSDMAQYMAKSDSLIPAHLRGNVGACMGVIMDAVDWKMNPFKLARMHMVVNGVGSYMSQAITAVMNSRAPIKGRLMPTFSGEGPNLVCTVKATTDDGQELEYVSPAVKDIDPKNSPLWKSDVRQQLSYYSFRAFARRYFPDLLMGVYDPEEAAQASREMRDITPKPVDNMLNDDPVEEALEGEIMPKTGFDKQVEKDNETLAETVAVREHTRDNPPHDPETGELFTDEPETVITPELLAANLIKSINGFTDKVMLEEYQQDNQVAINGLPGPLSKQVRKALSDKHFDLEEL